MTNARQHDAAALIGQRIAGKYEVRRLLGQGGMGAVFEAENLFLRAPVAIKVLRPEAAMRDELVRRFAQEAQAAAQVRHTNIVSVLDFGFDESLNALYLVQEYLEGHDLKAHLKAFGPLAPAASLELLLPLMRALSFAHSRGVVHRDIKPDNIFLCSTPDGVVPKLIDFGIAKVLDTEGQSAQQTRTTLVMGTPLYMSPEQARGERAVDHQTDVWQLGVVLYHMLTGRFPFEGPTPSIITAAIIMRAPTRIEVHAPHLPADIAALVHGAVETQMERRFPTMDAFWQAARVCAAAQGSQAVAGPAAPQQPPVTQGTHFPTTLTPGPQSADTASPRVLTLAPATHEPRNMLVLAVLGGALAVGVGVVAATRVFAARSEPPRPTARLVAPAPPPVAPPAVVAPPEVAQPRAEGPTAVHAPAMAPLATAPTTTPRVTQPGRSQRRGPPSHIEPIADTPAALRVRIAEPLPAPITAPPPPPSERAIIE